MKRSDLKVTETARPRDIDSARARTDKAQADAADPTASVWVNANAGTGKTHVLTLRVLRLLLSGTEPQRILCLTYTKAAAAEMSTRVFDKLGSWVTASDEDLRRILTSLTGNPPDTAALDQARTLFTRAIETPGGLKVQTIHSFAERLLQRFPLEAGIAPGFRILDDDKTRELKARAITATLADATSASHSTPLSAALALAIRYATEGTFDDLLSKMLDERAWLEAASRMELGRIDDDFAAVENYLRQLFGVSRNASTAALTELLASVASAQELNELGDYLGRGGATDIKHAKLLRRAAQSKPQDRVNLLEQYFVSNAGKSDEKPRKALMSSSLASERPDLQATAERAQGRFFALRQEHRALTLIEATSALYRLTGHALGYYFDSKRAAGALDFDDLIARTINLLLSSSTADWVLYKLDGGLDHILVDEAQDTSPEQWDIISALGREFFAGSSARTDIRTIFAVGDDKQSIYSFQGAAPQMFAEKCRHFAALTASAGGTWRELPLNLSFRTVQPILDAVDAVFADERRTPGLTSRSGTKIEHIASRFGQSGLIELWPTETHGDTVEANPWDPLSDSSARAPVNRLAERLAAMIAHWLETQEVLPSQGRPIRPGDILILVRKRHPFVVPMVAALKARNIPVAGADRMALTEQIAVMDLIELGKFLTLPEDDLALATVLKSPLFDFDDDDLLILADGRKGALWKALLAHAPNNSRFGAAAATLKGWRAKADFAPPFEFYSSLLDRDGGRRKILHRLGPEAADAIDEFLDIALAYDDSSPPSLTGFLAALREGGREVKRDMEHGRDEVRVMTVHGAKGLEAPIVILPDTCTTASGESGLRLMKLTGVDRPANTPWPVIWPVKGTSRLKLIADASRNQQDRETEERNRLLYVAMTRARDRLYFCGFENQRGRSPGCWYDLFESAMTPHLSEAIAFDGQTVRRIASEQTAAMEASAAVVNGTQATEPLPDFATRRAPSEAQLSVPLSPSQLDAYQPDAEGEPLPFPRRSEAEAGDRPSPVRPQSTTRFLRGTLTHALLEHLPTVPEARQRATAQAYVENCGRDLSSDQRHSIVNETLAIFSNKDFAPIFSTASRAEVPVAAVIPHPLGKGPALKLSGQIDRIAITSGDVMIVDYKTNRPPPQDIAKVAPAYLFQLAAYVLTLREIFPDRPVRCALLWTDGPRLMEIPRDLVDAYIVKLWELDPVSLDAS